MISPIFIAFLLLAALLLWFVIGARGKWWLKLPLIIIVPAFSFVVWSSLASFSGWPTTNASPRAAYYLYGYSVEPDSNQNIKGAVYIWLIPNSTKHGVFDYAPKAGEPRAYKLPYSRKLEQQVQQANAEVAHGQMVEFSRPASKGGHGRGKSNSSSHNSKGNFHFYPFRPQPLPRKSVK